MLAQYVKKYPIPSWEWFFNQEKVIKILEHISTFITKDTIPSVSLIFNAFIYTSFDDLKVVLVGQDPYPNPKQACGLSFSCDDDIPKPLSNVFTVLEKTVPEFVRPKTGDLKKWALQGVFLINSALTCQISKSGSHEKIWIPFINILIEQISERKRNTVFLLWGKNAQKLKERVDKKKHYILVTTHPSPYSAEQGFLQSNHFQLTNKYLRENKLPQIDWTL